MKEGYDKSLDTVQEYYNKILKVFKKTIEKNDAEYVESLLEDADIHDRLNFLVRTIDQQDLSKIDRDIVEQAKKNLNLDTSQSIDLDDLREEYKHEPEKLGALDALQAGLDIAGFEPTLGSFADGANIIIYSMRSAKSLLTGEGKKAKEHLLDAGISAVSLIPFADVVKVLRLRKVPKVAKATIKGARGLKSYAKTEKVKRVKDKTGYQHKMIA